MKSELLPDCYREPNRRYRIRIYQVSMSRKFHRTWRWTIEEKNSRCESYSGWHPAFTWSASNWGKASDRDAAIAKGKKALNKIRGPRLINQEVFTEEEDVEECQTPESSS